MSLLARSVHILITYATMTLLTVGAALAPAGQAGAAAGPLLDPVPDSAFLQPEDVGANAGFRPDQTLRPYLRPPRPCAVDHYPSDLVRVAEGTMAFDVPVDDFHTIVLEHVAGYRGDGAARYLRELRRALSAGTGCSDQVGRWTLLDVAVAGPGSLLIELREDVEDPVGNPKTRRSYLVAARVEKAVVVLSDIGWESGSGDQDTVLALIDAALRRAATLN